MKKFFSLILCIVVCFGLYGCKSDKVENEVSKNVSLVLNGYNYNLNPELDGNWIEPYSMAGDAPNYFCFSGFNGYSISVQGVQANEGQEVEIQVEDGKLEKSKGIAIEFTNNITGKKTTQYVRTLNQGFPILQTENNGAKDGCYYFEPTMDWLCKMNTKSEILYFNYNEENFNDFCPYFTEDGKKYYGYKMPYSDGNKMVTIGGSDFNPSKQVILDENYRVVKEILGTLDKDGNWSEWGLDCHDFIFIDLDHYITLSYVPTYVDNIPLELNPRAGYPVRVMATVIQEVKNGQVIFEWNSTDYEQFYKMSVEGNDFSMTSSKFCDYVHTNSITICPNDNNIVLSMRHNDSVVEINRKSGDIEWILGGLYDEFGLTTEQKTCRQHYARFTETGSLTVFDNSTNGVLTEGSKKEFIGNGTGMARAVEYVLDEENKKLVSFEAYEPGLVIGEFMGSTQKTDDSTFLMGWGGTMTHQPSTMFSEIDYKNKKVLFEVVNMNGTNISYRVCKSDN